jgi:histone deacetylase complex regulatory component SIN3
LTESGVYQEVAKLFQNEKDLMRDFRDFLPDASLDISDSQADKLRQLEICGREKSDSSAEQSLDEQIGVGRMATASISATSSSGAKKRPLLQTAAGPSNAIATKKAKGQTNKITYETSISEILEEIPLKDFIFFEKVLFTNFQLYFKFHFLD